MLLPAVVWRLQISMKSHVANSSQAAALVTAIILGNAPLLGSALGTLELPSIALAAYCISTVL